MTWQKWILFSFGFGKIIASQQALNYCDVNSDDTNTSWTGYWQEKGRDTALTTETVHLLLGQMVSLYK